jgi:hypothetical protein
MKQTVTITRLADRHAELHEREFAETDVVTVDAGELDVVVGSVCGGRPNGRYIIVVDEPHEED